MRKRLKLQEFAEGIRSGHRVVLSQAITLVESKLESDQALASALVQEVLPFTGQSIRIGITGVPGVGKSTFIETFGKILLDQGKKVAVLAVDPSSQLTKRAFIRPSPSGNTLGGVSGKTREAMLLCEAAGFEVILVETVGVGQSETAVKNMVDFFLLLMLAGAGDELQGIKKGIMEMADALVIHKADGDNLEAAQKAKVNYQNALHLAPQQAKNWDPKVMLASSVTELGIKQVWSLIGDYETKMKASGFWESNRAGQRLSWLEDQIQELLGQAFSKNEPVQSLLHQQRPLVKSGVLHPGLLAQRLVNMLVT
jgi:LAO/AO transport system kinase